MVYPLFVNKAENSCNCGNLLAVLPILTSIRVCCGASLYLSLSLLLSLSPLYCPAGSMHRRPTPLQITAVTRHLPVNSVQVQWHIL
jgi:hypothetical protein